VEVSLEGGKKVLIGSDEPDKLASAISDRHIVVKTVD